MCPYGAGRGPAGSGGGRVYTSAFAGGIIVVYRMAVSSLWVYELVVSKIC